MDLTARRQLLQTDPNPTPRLDYVVSLSGSLPRRDDGLLAVRYVPDRLLLPPEAFRRYLAALAALDGGLERLAGLVLEDMLNELVPRWVEVRARAGAGPRQDVLLVDRQPHWDNPSLLQRLAPPPRED